MLCIILIAEQFIAWFLPLATTHNDGSAANINEDGRKVGVNVQRIVA